MAVNQELRNFKEYIAKGQQCLKNYALYYNKIYDTPSRKIACEHLEKANEEKKKALLYFENASKVSASLKEKLAKDLKRLAKLPKCDTQYLMNNFTEVQELLKKIAIQQSKTTK